MSRIMCIFYMVVVCIFLCFLTAYAIFSTSSDVVRSFVILGWGLLLLAYCNLKKLK
jgi:uncharacterized membrane protein